MVVVSPQSSETPLRKLRLRIAQFLGSLGGEYNISLVDTTDTQTLELAVAWDTAKRLDFAVPFHDMKPSVYLGEPCNREDFPFFDSSVVELLHSVVGL